MVSGPANTFYDMPVGKTSLGEQRIAAASSASRVSAARVRTLDHAAWQQGVDAHGDPSALDVVRRLTVF
jgi:hypothetical protein